MLLAQKCDSGFGGSFVVLSACWNMLVCMMRAIQWSPVGMIETILVEQSSYKITRWSR